MNIYQLFVRVFGNKNGAWKPNGTREQNGCGTFNDITGDEIDRLKSLGISHIWLTGVIRHSTSSDYSGIGLKPTNKLITKGLAGSPYSILDYYDVDPDLAVKPENRMAEFEAAVDRIHKHGLKVIIDLIPNHLAREYKSVCKPDYINGFGVNDDKNMEFSPANNFYYCPNELYVNPIGDANEYREFPARASGNDVFRPNPSVNDWYDTVKLNYGVDYRDGSRHFEFVPDTWRKMLNIIRFWCSKGVDGFRVDMAEMVPVEFWHWAIAKIRNEFNIIMIAEIYQPNLYKDFLDAGFDYLYDKVGLYNTLENIYRHGQRAETISEVWKRLNGLDDNMLRFMENHDEVRLASKHFMKNARNAFPFVAMSALMNRGPFMIYNGQEYGEDADGAAGFSGDDGRTSIFDYVSMKSVLKDDRHSDVYEFYCKLLNFREKNPAIRNGAFYDLMWANPWYSDFDPQYVYAFLRYCDDEKLLIVINFNLNEGRKVTVTVPEDAVELVGGCRNEYQVELNPGEVKIVDLLNVRCRDGACTV